uniref:hypothetical protein n=1 Tax=Nonomuraea sp. CA-252377 TaxID=3240003 RepID=UPI003F4914BF
MPDENEDGPTSDDPAGGDGIERINFAGFMTIRGSTAVCTELHRRKQQFGRYIITADGPSRPERRLVHRGQQTPIRAPLRARSPRRAGLRAWIARSRTNPAYRRL